MVEGPVPGVRRVVLDVDTGIDDALALLYAVASPALELCGVTTVSGNVPVEVAARNSAGVLARACAGGVPVAIGAARASTGSGPRGGPTDHGIDGLGGVPVSPDGPRLPVPRPGVEALVAAVARGGAFTLVGLAPMTNLPELAPLATDLVLVGGQLAVGGPAELNAGHDPVATARVLASGRPTLLYVVDVLEQVAVQAADVDRLRSSERPCAQLAGALLAARRSRLVGDAGALVLLTHPELFVIEQRRVGVSDDRLIEAPEGRLLDVVVGVDAAAVAHAFVDVALSA